jgi:plasmid stabilization system protein ParE
VSLARTIVVAARAAKQIRDAERWWQLHRMAAPHAIGEELAHIYIILSVSPQLGVPIRHAKLANVRRLHLDRISYDVYYRLVGRSTVLILAFWHSRRDARPPV